MSLSYIFHSLYVKVITDSQGENNIFFIASVNWNPGDWEI